MSATAASTSIVEPKSEPSFGREWLNAALIRWNVSDEFVRYLDSELLPTEHPLREVIGQDFPKVMRELVRLRPDLI
ncbi:MAG: hypothetical protein ACR2JB_20860 [Bryobacteraceae bacterium]